MFDFPPIKISGKEISVKVICENRNNATARISFGALLIRIPNTLNSNEMYSIASSLYKKAAQKIEKNGYAPERKELDFYNALETTAYGKKFGINVVYAETKNPKAFLAAEGAEYKINITMPSSFGKKQNKDATANLVYRVIGSTLAKKVEEHIAELNARHFGSAIKKIRIFDSKTKWGHLSSNGVIMLNFRLLYLPTEIIDCVIIHELAHTKAWNHKREFYDIVEGIIPDYREKMKWLRSNGWDYYKRFTLYGKM
jgi:predicted metal-dependent hydrolase